MPTNTTTPISPKVKENNTMTVPNTLASVATKPARTPEDPPLRSSCDSCNLAKVRCSKDRPACQRCAGRGIGCVYSVSLRGTKRHRQQEEYHPLESRAPARKKRITSYPSPIAIDPFPLPHPVAQPEPVLPFPDWDCDLPSSAFSIDDTQSNQLFNMLSNTITDSPYFSSLPSTIGATCSSSSTRSSSVSYMTMAPATPPTPASPTFPLTISPADSPSSAWAALIPATTCQCEKRVVDKLVELNASQDVQPLSLHQFLTEHKANMAVCTSVLECTDPQHKQGMLLLVQLIALLIHIIVSFDQILHPGCGLRMSQEALSSNSSSELDYRKEKVLQANILRTELAKVGVLIQDFDRRYCLLNSDSCMEGLFLLSPLLTNLQWKTQEKFDAVRLWAPSLC